MLKHAILAAVTMGVTLAAHADTAPATKIKPPVNQASPNYAQLKSTGFGTSQASSTSGNAGGTGTSKGTGTNPTGSGKVVVKSSSGGPKKSGTSGPTPAAPNSSLPKATSIKPQVKPQIKQPHLI